jgi:hypothetical protein
MILKYLPLILLLFIALNVGAYEGDYIWEDKLKAKLPIAEQGDVQAQYEVGVMYEKGRGTDRNQAMAFKWYIKAAKQGNKKASFKVGYGFLKGRGVSKDTEKAYKWLTRASKKGYERAEFYLGEMYEKGNGVSRNYGTALKWYRKALKGGFEPAASRIENIKTARDHKERDRLSAIKRAKRRTEAKANRQLARQKKARAHPVSISQSKFTTKELILQGGWKKRNRPAEYMPSKISKCKDTGATIECVSKTLTRNIGMADISYQTKSIVFGIKDSGKFKVSYRNNVLDIKITDPEFEESGAEVPVTRGWQKAKHSLTCTIKNSTNKVVCKKNKFRTVKLSR